MNEPKVGMSVKVLDTDGNTRCKGYIIRVFPPCEYHSGRFHVQLHEKGNRECECEFWYSDFGKTVKEYK